jgi:DNA-binding NtrC family response regulator
LVGTHRSNLVLQDWCVRIAPTDIIAAIIGESGTGKRVVANLIPRAVGPERRVRGAEPRGDRAGTGAG